MHQHHAGHAPYILRYTIHCDYRTAHSPDHIFRSRKCQDHGKADRKIATKGAALSLLGTAEGYLNRVRHRAGLADTSGLDQANFRKVVFHERRVELAFENHRWFDLKRTMTPAELAASMNVHGAQEKANPTVGRGNIAFNTLDYVFSDYEYVLPIPAPEILINSKLTPNPGYN